MEERKKREKRPAPPAGAAALLVQTANRYRSAVSLERGGETVNAKSIMGVMMLAAAQGSEVNLKVEGPDEKETVAEILRLVGDGFGEKR